MGEGEGFAVRKLRVLCLHGFRTSAEIMKSQLGKWPDSVLEKFDLVFLDAPFPSGGKSDVEGFYPPPYYEWFHYSSEDSEFPQFDECLTFVEDFMANEGPFDGIIGFSLGAILAAALSGMQAKGLALTKVPKVKFLIIIGGGELRPTALREKAYSSPIECPSLHFIGEEDFMKPSGEMLLKSFVNPAILRHEKGHTIPKLDEEGLVTMLNFIQKIQKIFFLRYLCNY